MNHRSFLTLAAILTLMLPGCRRASDRCRQVDPYIGAGGHGHVFVGANVPFGMVRLGPHQPNRGWDWCSGYHYSDTVVLGFSHTRLSGTGIGEGGDILLFPFDASRPHSGGGGRPHARLDHSKERVAPGYYHLEMPENGIRVDLTATARTGIHRYAVTSGRTGLLVDLRTGTGWDAVTGSALRLVDDHTVEGWRRSTGWAQDHCFYFRAEFSLPIANADSLRQPMESDNGVIARLLFDTSADRVLEVRVGLSPSSCAGAGENLHCEADWAQDFDAIRHSAHELWRKTLSAIEIKGLDAEQEKVFYTALYHASFDPSVFGDVGNPEPEYSVFSLWDVYRAQFPLLTLIRPDFCRELASTMLRIYRRQGKLPVWHLWGNETDCMVGNPGVIALSDLFLKGLVADSLGTLEALRASSLRDERDMDNLRKYGFCPYDKSTGAETVSKGLEYAIADAGVSRVAAVLGDTLTAGYFARRAQSYHCYYDAETGFVRGRASDLSWRSPFDPFNVSHMTGDFTEGNAWQYTWLVPHDVYGCIAMLGGEQTFARRLDEFFVTEGDLGSTASDVTGLVGQYAHGNEPSHHIAYLYNYVGEQWKCAEKVRHILKNLYYADQTGVCGNEDCGQMSAWYILSSLGLYQVDPCGGDFLIGSPAVRRAEVQVGNGRTLRIIASNNSPRNIYVASLKVNGQPWTRSCIPYDVLSAGATLEFTMSPEPTDFGSAPDDRP